MFAKYHTVVKNSTFANAMQHPTPGEPHLPPELECKLPEAGAWNNNTLCSEVYTYLLPHDLSGSGIQAWLKQELCLKFSHNAVTNVCSELKSRPGMYMVDPLPAFHVSIFPYVPSMEALVKNKRGVLTPIHRSIRVGSREGGKLLSWLKFLFMGKDGDRTGWTVTADHT